MKELTWQPVPGTKGVYIYPITRKPDIVCSNTYILKTESQIILVDPGGLSDHMENIKKVIKGLAAEKTRQIFIYLTHCHADHSLNAVNDKEPADLWNARIAAQEYGANGLEQMDEKVTLADILCRDIAGSKIDIKLLSADDMRACGVKKFDLEDGVSISIVTNKTLTGGEYTFYRQVIPIGPLDNLEIYFTPGHSPDGTCMRTGDILIIGDLLFGANPLISGTYGWSQKDFIESLKKVEWLIKDRNIMYCCPGHGRIIDSKAALAAIHNVIEEAGKLGDIDEVNPEKIQYLRDYSSELLDEAGEIFSIITGRMYYISYQLENLGEEEEAKKYMELIHSDKIDEFLTDFNRYVDEFKSGKNTELQLVLKAVQITQKIDSVFESDKVEHVVDLPLLRNAKGLLNDFLSTIRGYRIKEEAEPIILNDLIDEVIVQLKTPPSSENFLESADKEDEFLRELISHIAYQPIFEEVSIEFSKGQDLPLLYVVKERFSDAVAGVLEEFACLDASKMSLASGHGKDRVFIKISASGDDKYHELSAKKISMYNRKFGLFGGSFKRRMSGDKAIYIIDMPVIFDK